MAGFGAKATVKLTLNFDKNKEEYNKALGKLVRAGTIKVQQLAVVNLYAGIYAAPENPKKPRTGFLVGSVYSQTGDGSLDDKDAKVAAAHALNPNADTSVSDFEPGKNEGKVGVGAEYGIYMEAYSPFLEPAAAEVQEQFVELWENPD